jgi:small subunit ribosomal protein S7
MLFGYFCLYFCIVEVIGCFFIKWIMKLYKRLFINSLVLNGNKTRAFNFFNLVLFGLKVKLGVSPFFILVRSIRNVSPIVGLRVVKLGGINYRVPVPIFFYKSLSCSVRWLVRDRFTWRRLSFRDIYINVLAGFFNKGVGIMHKRNWYSLAIKNRLYIRFVL